jgi:DNA-binding response OmpR family regulator
MADRKKILIADDSPTSLVWEKLILGDADFEIITATDGEAALDKAIAERPSLIVLDVVMPKLSGLDVCRKLRARSESRLVPIIIVSERTDESDIRAAREAGCNDFMKKPVDRAALLAKVDRYLRRRQDRSANPG